MNYEINSYEFSILSKLFGMRIPNLIFSGI